MQSSHEHMSISEKISRMGLTVLLFLLPLFVVPTAIVSVQQSKMYLVLSVLTLLAGALIVRRVAVGHIEIPKHLLLLAALGIPVAYVFSALNAGWVSASVVNGLGTGDTVIAASVLFFLLLIVAMSTLGNQRDSGRALHVLVISGFALALFQIGRLLLPDALSLFGALPDRTSTLAGSWHDLGIILGLTVLVSLGLWHALRGRDRSRLFLLIAAGISFVMLVLVNMSDVWYVLGAEAALIGVFVSALHMKQGFLMSIRTSWVWFALAVISGLLAYGGLAVHERLPEPLKVTAVEVRPSWEGTFAVRAPEAAATGLLFGSGPNTFARNWALYKPQGVNSTIFWNLDFPAGVGTLPTSFVTVGLVGVIAWIILLLGFLWTSYRIVRSRLHDHTLMMPVVLVSATAFLLVFHVMYAPGFSITALLFVLLGLLIAMPISSDRSVISLPVSTRPHGLPGFFGMLSGALLVCAVTVTGVRALASETSVSRSVATYQKTNDIDASLAIVQQAINWYPNDRAHRAAVELGVLKLAQQAAENPTNAEAQEALKATLTTTIEHALSAVTLAESDYQNWLTVANLYQELAGVGVEGAYEQALNAYGKVREKNPTNPLPFFRAGQLEIVRGNNADAIALLNAAVTLKSDLPAAHFLLSQLYITTGKLEEGLRAAASAVQLVPQDPLAWYNLGTILFQGRSYIEARTAFEQATTLRTDYANAQFMLGITLAVLGDNATALTTLEKVRLLNPENATVDGVIKNIQAGKDPFFGLSL